MNRDEHRFVFLFQFDFDWDDPEDKFAPDDETWKAEKAAQLRDAIHRRAEGPFCPVHVH